ncbi:MAG: hypothetical protein U0165_00260 [Polyangiaceae bacterium]
MSFFRRGVFSVALIVLGSISLTGCSSDESEGKIVNTGGSAGSGGTAGSSGSSGSAGAGSSGGTSGSAGSSGASGSAGSSGSAGNAGNAGSSGSSGSAGSAGSSGGSPSVAFVAPLDGSTLLNPVHFDLTATDVDMVSLIADDMYSIAMSWDPTVASTYSFDYSFSTLGMRNLTLSGFVGSDPNAAATATIQITLEAPTMSLCDSVVGASFIPPTNCDAASGNTTTEKAPNSMYATSWFGCYLKGDGTIYQDPSDNCEFACGNQGLCDSSLSGPECEAQLKWFAADASRFGCGSHIRLTNCANGKQVVLTTLDVGPNCNSVEKNYGAPVIDMSHDAMVYLFDGSTYGGGDLMPVVVEEVDDTVPLGPVQ